MLPQSTSTLVVFSKLPLIVPSTPRGSRSGCGPYLAFSRRDTVHRSGPRYYPALFLHDSYISSSSGLTQRIGDSTRRLSRYHADTCAAPSSVRVTCTPLVSHARFRASSGLMPTPLSLASVISSAATECSAVWLTIPDLSFLSVAGDSSKFPWPSFPYC